MHNAQLKEFMKRLGYKLVRIDKSKSKAGKSKAGKAGKSKAGKAGKRKTGKSKAGKAGNSKDKELEDLVTKCMTKDMALSILEELGKDLPRSTPSENVKKKVMRYKNKINVETLQCLSKEDLIDLCRKKNASVTGTKEELAKKLVPKKRS